LPTPSAVDLDDELGLWEERDLLLGRLLECKTFKDAAVVLAAMEEQAHGSVPRRAGPDERFLALAPDLLAGVTPDAVRAAFLRACTPRPVPRVELVHLGAVRASVNDAVEELSRTLPGLGRTTFRRLTTGLSERLEIVVRFLALLELCKLGLVELHQAQRFGDIAVAWSPVLENPVSEGVAEGGTQVAVGAGGQW
jgi:segregation and condensation protein A